MHIAIWLELCRLELKDSPYRILKILSGTKQSQYTLCTRYPLYFPSVSIGIDEAAIIFLFRWTPKPGTPVWKFYNCFWKQSVAKSIQAGGFMTRGDNVFCWCLFDLNRHGRGQLLMLWQPPQALIVGADNPLGVSKLHCLSLNWAISY